MKSLALLTVILMSLLGANSAHAQAIACNPVDSNQVASYDGVNVDSLDANTRHCEFTGSDQQKNKHNHPAIVEQSNTMSLPTPKPPVIVPDVKKEHCNNGNGNGAEGCNASDKGNNDETPAKGDKDINHPTH